MNHISKELADYVSNSKSLIIKTVAVSNLGKKVSEFLDARMDEIRLFKAGSLVLEVLKETDYDDMEFFREGVLKRESSGVISYQGQRDHSAHTLYNWLLGWYIYEHNAEVRKQMSDHISSRRRWDNQQHDEVVFFSHVWQFTSLLHDIGYIFEGNIASTDANTRSDQAEIGMRVTKDYLESKFWMSFGFSSMHERYQLKEKLNLKYPEIKHDLSIVEIADYLCSLGKLDELHSNVRHQLINRCKYGNDALQDVLHGDAFDLWIANYEYYEQSGMAIRFKALREIFETLLFNGIKGFGVRVLDHGVCGGLLQLLISTRYYNIVYAIENLTKGQDKATVDPILQKFKNRNPPYEYDCLYWWTGIVWATASVAIHNLQQSPKLWPNDSFKKLELTEDPLAYLGILVDLLQEFDRYSVFPNKDKAPLQNTDVLLGSCESKIVLKFPEERVVKIKKELDACLKDWDQIIDLRVNDSGNSLH